MSPGFKRLNGHHTSVVNLATSYQMTWYYPTQTLPGPPVTIKQRFNAFANTPQPAFYAKKNSAGCGGFTNGGAAYKAWVDSLYANPLNTAASIAAAIANYGTTCFTKVVVSATSGPGATDERQNFANWYAYSRTRALGAITGLVTAMSSTSSDLRATCQTLENTVSGACNTTIPPMETMDAAGRTALVQKLINTPMPGDTALREAGYRAIQYFKGSGNSGPWAFSPSTGVKAPEYSCRQSYHMMVTDGEWTGTGASASPISDQDRNLIRPYRDRTNPAAEVTLADVAFEAWNTDLRPDMPDNVPLRIVNPAPANPTAAQLTARNNDPDNDPAAHQHLSTFTVGFGVNGALTYPSDLGALKSGGKAWTAVFKDDGLGNRISNGPGRIDDLWHAAINGRGKYFSAGNPTQLATDIQAVIDLVTKGTASGASAASSSNVGSNTTSVYIGNYTGGSWSGDVKSYPIVNGVVQTTPSWSAAAKIDALTPSARNIYFREGANTGSFSWANMTAPMKDLFDRPLGSSVSDGQGDARVRYLRGERTGEQKFGGDFRNRTSALGDIVNSSTAYVAGPIAGYDETRFTGYTAYANSKANRQPMLYFGANDGMLHGVRASNGIEQFAYIPGAVLAKTRWLPEVAYAHQTFVDATPYAADVNVGGWKTLLFAPFGTGAKGLFALNVTDPTAMTASSSVWELTSAATPELGYVMGTPQRHPVTGVPRNVGKFGTNGNWAVFLPNGYNSDRPDENGIRSLTGSASLIVADLGTAPSAAVASWTLGTNLHVIPTPAAGDGPYNGLSMPTGVDINGDGKIDVLYAGDLKGNLWKFELTDPTTGWVTSYPIASIQVKRLFKAVNGSGQDQPITVAPSIIRMGDGKYIVVFGTGRLLTTADKTRPPTGFPVQSLYGIIDDGGVTEITRPQLYQQKIVQSTPATGTGPTSVAGSRFTDAVANQTGTYRGWRMDLDSTSAQDEGERVVSNPIILPGGAVVFSTSAPSIDACSQLGTGWTMILNGLNGGRPVSATFDLNRDGNTENDSQIVSGKKMYASGMQSEVGVSPTPLVLSTGSTIQLVTGGASRGWSSAQVTLANSKVDLNGRPLWGRISWQEIGR
jgi:type IV pilus assembly protein PilY1